MDKPYLTAYDEIYDFLLSNPTPEEVIAFKPSSETVARVHSLLQREKSAEMTEADSAELDEFERLEHFVRMFKARARIRLANE